MSSNYSKSGKAGGIARAAVLTAEQRSAIARKAVQARWASPHRQINIAKQLASEWGCSETTCFRAMRHLDAMRVMAEKYPAFKLTIQRALFEPEA